MLSELETSALGRGLTRPTVHTYHLAVDQLLSAIEKGALGVAIDPPSPPVEAREVATLDFCSSEVARADPSAAI